MHAQNDELSEANGSVECLFQDTAQGNSEWFQIAKMCIFSKTCLGDLLYFYRHLVMHMGLVVLYVDSISTVNCKFWACFIHSLCGKKNKICPHPSPKQFHPCIESCNCDYYTVAFIIAYRVGKSVPLFTGCHPWHVIGSAASDIHETLGFKLMFSL